MGLVTTLKGMSDEYIYMEMEPLLQVTYAQAVGYSPSISALARPALIAPKTRAFRKPAALFPPPTAGSPPAGRGWEWETILGT